jgi:hypothetical protein
VPFNPDVAIVMVVPVTVDPAGVGMRRPLINAWNPNILIAVPAVVACVPGIVWVFVGRWWNNLARPFRRADAYYDLCVCDSCGEDESTDC